MAEALDPKAATEAGPDCALPASNDNSDLTESELLDLLNDELNNETHQNETGSSSGEREFRPLVNGLDGDLSSDENGAHSNACNSNAEVNGAIEVDLVEADINTIGISDDNNAIVKSEDSNNDNRARGRREASSSSIGEEDEDDSVEADTYKSEGAESAEMENVEISEHPTHFSETPEGLEIGEENPEPSGSEAPESESCQASVMENEARETCDSERLENRETPESNREVVDNRETPETHDDKPEAENSLLSNQTEASPDRDSIPESESGIPKCRTEAESDMVPSVSNDESGLPESPPEDDSQPIVEESLAVSVVSDVVVEPEMDSSEAPEDEMHTMNQNLDDSPSKEKRSSGSVHSCSITSTDAGPNLDISTDDAPESDLLNHNQGDVSDPAPFLLSPPTNDTAAQNQHCDRDAESPSTESLNNAPEDEQMQNESDVLVNNDVLVASDDVVRGEECPEEDQFVNPSRVDEEQNASAESRACAEPEPEVAPTSGKRGSSDDELLCVEADLATRHPDNQMVTAGGARQPSSSPDQRCEPECDQSNGNLQAPAGARPRPRTPVNCSLESVELSSAKDEDFGDFVQSEPSSPLHHSPETSNTPKTLLALADHSQIDPTKLNPEDLISISRRSSNQSLDSCDAARRSSNQSLDSCGAMGRSSNQSLDSYDVMARSVELSEDDDDAITVTSYRELLRRYQQLREQKELDLGPHFSAPPPPSPSDSSLLAELTSVKNELVEKEEEMAKVREKMEKHDEVAKRTINQLQTEMKTRVDQVTKMYDEVLAEKDGMVVKFAQQELKNTEYIRKQEAMEAKFREYGREREMLISKLKSAGLDKSRLSAQLHAKHTEVINGQKEIHKLKDALSSQDVKVKWAHNKLKNEIEGHKETKANLEKTLVKLKETREETETIRRNTQQMIKTYQESEDIKSNSLDQQLKEKMAQWKQEQQERRDQDEVHQMVINELEALKRKHKECLEEMQAQKDKLITLEQECRTQEKCLTSYKDSLQLTKRENEEQASRLAELENIAAERDKANAEAEDMRQEVEQIRQQDKEYASEAENCRARETQLLELTEKLTNKNALLQSENTSLNTKNSSALSELEHLKNSANDLSKTCKRLKEELHDQEVKTKEDNDRLNKSLKEKTKQTEDLRRLVDDKADEIKVIKRRQAAQIKDLTRQLQQAKRRLESHEPPSSEKADSLGSRTSSSTSLDAMSPASNNNQAEQSDTNYSTSSEPSSMELPSMAETPVVRHVEPDKQMLIERIVKLQRINARKSEKIEFLEDHINQLLMEIKKKNRLIQHYITREEAGALASNSSDSNKAQMTKRGGIMASLYSSHASDQTMTLDLSLQINGKLQAVLEDTLLKNITLKENIDTLGAEIARLSQENRQILLKTKKS